VSDATISWKVDDADTVRLLARQGSRLRDNVTAALARVTARVVAETRAAAPSARSAEGIKSYGTEQPDRAPANGRGIPRAMLDVITRSEILAARGELATVVSNEYYLARFRDVGFSGTVDVRAHTRRAPGRKGWGRSGFVGKFYSASTKKGNRLRDTLALARKDGMGARNMRLLAKGGQVAVDFKKGRRHSIKRTPFFPTEAEVDARVKPEIDRAVREGLTL